MLASHPCSAEVCHLVIDVAAFLVLQILCMGNKVGEGLKKTILCVCVSALQMSQDPSSPPVHLLSFFPITIHTTFNVLHKDRSEAVPCKPVAKGFVFESLWMKI